MKFLGTGGASISSRKEILVTGSSHGWPVNSRSWLQGGFIWPFFCLQANFQQVGIAGNTILLSQTGTYTGMIGIAITETGAALGFSGRCQGVSGNAALREEAQI